MFYIKVQIISMSNKTNIAQIINAFMLPVVIELLIVTD